MNLFEMVKASINTREAAQRSTITAWRCARSTMTVIRACMCRMTTTTVLPVGSMGM